jgi:hypothetical protein
MLLSFFRSVCSAYSMLVSFKTAPLGWWLRPSLPHPCLPSSLSSPSLVATHWEWFHPCVFCHFFFPADFSNVPEITTGLKRSQTEGTLDQVPHREKMEQTFLVRRQPRSQAKSQALVLEVGDIKRWTFSLPGSTSWCKSLCPFEN